MTSKEIYDKYIKEKNISFDEITELHILILMGLARLDEIAIIKKYNDKTN